MMTKQTNEPAHEIRLGKLRCQVWANEHPENGTWYSMTVVRCYDDGGREKTAHSFGRDDALVLAEIARQAYLWIARQQSGTGLGEDASK